MIVEGCKKGCVLCFFVANMGDTESVCVGGRQVSQKVSGQTKFRAERGRERISPEPSCSINQDK